MEPLVILRADPLDLLFENRNKDYGAYPLRKYYAQRLLLSLGIVFSCVVLLSYFYLSFRDLTTKRKMPAVVGDLFIGPYVPIQPVKLIVPPSIPSAPKPPSAVVLKTPVIVRDARVTSMTSVEDLGTHIIGLETISGQGHEDHQPGNRNGSLTVAKAPDSTEGISEIFDRVEQMPEFPGGQEALKRFLQKNLRMPENNMEAGTQVKIYARFVVGKDGRVRDAEITQGSDEVFNKEVRRVILKMPDWKPGMQHNRNVAVYFSLPVNFVAAE